MTELPLLPPEEQFRGKYHAAPHHSGNEWVKCHSTSPTLLALGPGLRDPPCLYPFQRSFPLLYVDAMEAKDPTGVGILLNIAQQQIQRKMLRSGKKTRHLFSSGVSCFWSLPGIVSDETVLEPTLVSWQAQKKHLHKHSDRTVRIYLTIWGYDL